MGINAATPRNTGKQKRLSPDDRRKAIVQKATDYFADEGFKGGTRELARRIGVTQPLLYRYFPSKNDLIREVYRTLHFRPLENGWDVRLTDRARPLRTRLLEFYDYYTDVIFNRTWLRLLVFSGLDDLDVGRVHARTICGEILTCIVREVRLAADVRSRAKPTVRELEKAWAFHSGIVSYGVRRHVYDWPVLEDRHQMIARAIDAYLAEVIKAPVKQNLLANNARGPTSLCRAARRG